MSIKNLKEVVTFFYISFFFIVPPVLLQTISTLRSLINCLVGDGSSDSSPIRLNHN